ncbi:hypothetical protein OPU71_06470 [Niveibacterium sp. 24ML]|uniref:hypothetical protein n=1 Tax=Niveibacterium sp. 24ML TaxID=2985512 RepID=UPI00226EBC23|nr:hypothetical protein [Niveibacterium sp. 24ML]MCX9155769.1 hypothetical protein [Niveibacterium sp. 24ML]
MRIFDTLSAQIDSVGLPLFAVTLAAVPRADTPLLMFMHWHGFRREGPRRTADASREARPVASSALQINSRWQAIAHIESDVLDAAWQLGAWNLERDEKRACNTVGAPLSEALACRQAFGDYPAFDERETLLAEAPDRASLMQLAAEVGYVQWQFRPVAGGVWAASGGDDTLDASGHRAPPCPVSAESLAGGARRSRRTVYRLGAVHRLIV